MNRCVSKNKQAAQARARRSFTLIELVLALILMAAMMTLTWNMMGAFKNQLDAGAQQSEERQLVRSLHFTLQRDLQGAQAPPDKSEDGSESYEASEDEEASSNAAAASNSNATTQDEPAVPQPPSMRSLASNDNAPSSGGSNDYSFTPDFSSFESSSASESDDPRIPSAIDLFVEAKSVTHHEWRSDGVMFYGTSQALIFDAVRSPEAGERRQPDREPDMNHADLPDSIRRFVYIFTDPESARLSDRPPGLIRVQLTAWQQTKLRQMTGDQLDLVDLLKPALPAPTLNDSMLPGDSIPSAGPFSTTATPKQVLGQDPNQRPSAFLGSDHHRHLNFGAHLDYMPEIAVLMFRYYDGEYWTSFWDGRSRGLPVAVEIRFQLASEVRQRLAAQTQTSATGDDALTDRFGTSLDATSNAANDSMNDPLESIGSESLEPLEEDMRSSLTQPPQDHRFLIYMRRPPESKNDFDIAAPFRDADSDASSRGESGRSQSRGER